MELELNWERMNYHELLLDTQVCREETQETIVPDSYPDILRIVEAGGQLCLTEKELKDGGVTVGGTVDGWLLYEPESGDGLCKIDYRIPFTVNLEAPGVTAQGRCVVRPVLGRIDARTLNPRKVLVRADICADVCVYEHRELPVCCGMECSAEMGVQQLTGERRAYLTTAVCEKPFSVYEEVHAPAGLDAEGELVCMSAQAWCTEARLIGSKLVIKGEAGVRVRYLAGGQMNSTCIPVNFSQILEVEGAGEQADCSVSLYVTNVECTRAGEDGRQLNIALELMGQAVVADSYPLVALQDAYSTCGELTVEMQNFFVTDLLERYVRPQSMRELLETQVQAKSVVDASVRVCRVSISGANMETQLQADVMYLDERDQLHTTGRTILISGQLEVPEGAQCRMSCTCPGEAFAAVTAGGLEVRFNLEMRGCMTRQEPVVSVKNARWTERSRDAQESRPSVVMRAAMPGESLWDIAKAYSTTIRRIGQANGLEQDEAPVGRLLLIPAGR